MNTITLVEAVNQALAYELAQDDQVVVFGEDVGTNGGVFRATDGLAKKFGNDRVFDTPLAESMIAGITIGMASQGMKPVAEFQFMGFIYPAVEQIICHISRMRNRTRGRITCPLVLRAPYSGGIHAPEHHSESTEALFAHMPGLNVVIPSSAQQAYGLLRAAIHSPDPVIFLEPKRIYHTSQSVLDPDAKLPALTQCQTLCQGTDLTLIAWGAMIPIATKAVAQANNDGISVELIDLQSIKPLDMPTILTSVSQTGRCIIAHEAARTCGIGAEISARINETIWDALLAPVTRVTGYDTVMPLAKLENYYLPNHDDLYQSIRKLMEYPG